MTILTAAELSPEVEGRYYSPKMQWWCAHADLATEGGKDWSFYFWPALGSLDEAWIAALYTDDQVIDLTDLHLPVGTLQTGRKGVDVAYRNQYIRGTYPEYDIAVEGEHEGEKVRLELHMTATMPAFEALPNLRGITWHYVPQFRVDGTLTHGGKSEAVSGKGYLERRRGRFWAPGIKLGIWESIPSSASGLSIPLFYKVWRDDDSVQLQTLTFTIDGSTLVDFGNVEVEILETLRLPGAEEVDHPMRFRLRAEGQEGVADLEVVRSPHRLAMRDYFDDPDERAKVVGVYGPGRTSGTIQYLGETHRVDSRSFGSALFFSRR
jgi:hypothetical protein